MCGSLWVCITQLTSLSINHFISHFYSGMKYIFFICQKLCGPVCVGIGKFSSGSSSVEIPQWELRATLL